MAKKDVIKSNETIKQVPCVVQFKEDYGRYTFYVASHRVTPDANDGLIPVKRAVIIAAKLLTHVSPNRTTKCATIVGNILKIHPHGDTAAYDTLVNMANTFNCKYMIIKKHGSFGTVEGDKPASMRYTEATLTPFCYDVILNELESSSTTDYSVDWEDNYSKEIMIPSFLPARLPILFLNGTNNIGVGDKVEIPSHNITEVIDTLLAVLDDPSYPCILVPDHCQECEIVETNWSQIAKTGIGNYRVRAKIETMDYCGNNNDYKGCQVLRITSLPNFVYMNSILEKIDELITENKIIQIRGYENHAVLNEATEETNVDLWLILHHGSDPNYVKSELYSKTDLQKTFTINLTVMNKKDRLRMNYNQYFNNFLNYRRTTKMRIMANRLQDLQTQNCKYDYYIQLFKSGQFDEIEKYTRKQKGTETEVTDAIIKKFNINPIQAKYVLNSSVKMQSASTLAHFQAEFDKNQEEINMLDSIIRSGKIDDIIRQELLELKAKYGEPRKCKIVKSKSDKPSGIFRLVATDKNKMKLINTSDSITVSKGESPKFVMDVDISEDLLVFTSNGKVYKVPLSKVPFSSRNTSGEDIRLINKNIMSDIIYIAYCPQVKSSFEAGEEVVTLSKSGLIKRTSLDDFLNIALSGTTYCKVDNGDYVVDCCICSNDMNMMVYNKESALSIPVSNIPWNKRISKGSMSMKSDSVEGMCPIIPSMTDIVILTENGYLNRINPSSLSVGRAIKGSSVIRLKQGDSIKRIFGTIEDQHLIRCYCINGIIDIPVSEIKQGSSISGGTKMISNNYGNIIKAVLI